YERYPLARLEREADVAHRPPLAVGILEAHVLEDESLPDHRRHRLAAASRGDRRAHLEKVEEILEIEALLRNVARIGQEPLDDVAATPKRRREKGERADRDAPAYRPGENHHVRRVVAERAE